MDAFERLEIRRIRDLAIKTYLAVLEGAVIMDKAAELISFIEPLSDNPVTLKVDGETLIVGRKIMLLKNLSDGVEVRAVLVDKRLVQVIMKYGDLAVPVVRDEVRDDFAEIVKLVKSMAVLPEEYSIALGSKEFDKLSIKSSDPLVVHLDKPGKKMLSVNVTLDSCESLSVMRRYGIYISSLLSKMYLEARRAASKNRAVVDKIQGVVLPYMVAGIFGGRER